jgi:hypothetical protein
VEHHFTEIHIFCPSIQYKDEYYTQFHDNPKYHLYSENLHAELVKVIDKQKAAVRRAALDRRREEAKRKKEEKEIKERTELVVFKPARVNGRKQRPKKRQFNVVRGNEIVVDYPRKMRKWDMLLPDIFAGTPGKIQQQQIGRSRTLDTVGPQILIILDDCIGEGLFDGQGPAQELAARGRHFNASLIASSQHLTKVDIVIRNNADYWLFWNPHSIQELESFIEKFVSQNHRRQVRDVVQSSYQDFHDFIFYNPHVDGDWTEKFLVGGKDDFWAESMRPVFDDSMRKFFYPDIVNKSVQVNA